MISFFKKLWRDKRGNALVIAAAALPLVIGSAGLASDTIQWALWKRQLQRAADSGAIAGVYAIVQDSGARTNVGPAVDKDLTYNSHVGITTIKVVGQPTSGSYTTDPYAVQVQLSVQKRLSFSGMFMNFTPTITVNGTATVAPSGHYCVISLESTAVTGITATGSADVDMGCGMITNSTSLTAAVATGSSEVNASPIAAVGGIPASTHWGSGTLLQPLSLAQEDPFNNPTRTVNPPTDFPTQNCPNFRVNSNETKTSLTEGNDYRLTSDGYYCMGDMNLQGDVTLPSGTYVIDGGSLSIGAQAHVTCYGCTFILTSRSAATNPSSIGTVDMNGGAEVDMSNSASGPYAGILIYQDRRAPDGTSAGVQNRINGNANSSFQGAFYFPAQEVTYNGTAGMTTTCMQLVARRVLYSGNMNISNSCPANSGAHDFTGKKVRLVE
jgi:Flp pilus assembly protein TadG